MVNDAAKLFTGSYPYATCYLPVTTYQQVMRLSIGKAPAYFYRISNTHMTKKIGLSDDCLRSIQGIKDTQDLLSGKWKMLLLAALYYNGKFRFMDLARHVEGIAPKVLSKELKDLEMNQLVKRTVKDTMPITVEYELTPYAKSLKDVIQAMGDWGIRYRKSVLKK